MFNSFQYEAMGKLVLRLSVAIFMLFHGVAKVLHPDSLVFIGNSLSNIGLLSALAYGVYVGEIIAPLMVLSGFRCRIGALIIVVNMIFAIVLVHSGDLFSITKHGGWTLELQGFYLFGALAISLLGSGRYAIKPD